LFLGHPGVIDDLQQQIAQLVVQPGHVALFDGVGHLAGLLDGVGGNRAEILNAVPRTAIRRAKADHDFQQPLDPGLPVEDQRIRVLAGQGGHGFTPLVS
jgi:hypothetical protein